jgi:hypothetical protein
VVVPPSDANLAHPGEPADHAEQVTIRDHRAVPAPAGGAFPPELLAIWADPEVRRLAVRRTEDPDLAEDALLQAMCAVAQVADLERIKDLKAYFCRVLINEIYRLRGQLAAARPCDPATLAEMGDTRMAGRRSEETAVVTRLTVRTWLERFHARRTHLRASVPGRSGQPGRYRDLIVAVAEDMVRGAFHGDISQADTNEALQAAFPEWFGRPGAADNIHHQHLSRAHRDVRAVLRAVVNRDELLH